MSAPRLDGFPADAPRLVVVAGLPGTGMTTLARPLAESLAAAYLRVDAVETALERVTGTPAGIAGYAVVHEVAASNLLLGLPVVIDAVSPVPESRASWQGLAERAGAALTVLETRLDDAAEHRRRVEARLPDLPEQRVPTWSDVTSLDYAQWDEDRDGERTSVDTTDRGAALAAALVAIG